MASRPGRWLRALAVAALAAVLALALFALGVRFYLLPHVDDYRPALERYATRVMRTPVHIDHIEGRWGGLRPHLEVTGLRISDAQGVPSLSVPHAVLSLSWRSLVSWRADLSDLQVIGATVRAHRGEDGIWTVAGRRVERSADGGRLLDNPAWQWVLEQPRMSARDVTLVLEDERIAPHRWVFSDLQARTRHRGLADVHFEAEANPPASYGGTLKAQGRLSPALGRLLDRSAPGWTGQAAVAVDRLELARIAELFPGTVDADGIVDAQGQIAFTDVELGAWSADLSWADVALAVPRGTAVLGRGSAQLRGTVSERALAGALSLRDAALDLPGVFEAARVPVHALDGQLDLRFGAGEPLRLGFEDVRIDAGETALRAQFSARGRWQPGGRTRAGTLELEAGTERIPAAAIARYMPKVVGPGVRRWLRQGVTAGTLHDVRATVSGDLADFPFDRHPDAGTFRIAGRVSDAVIDAAPGAARPWPPFEAVNGEVVVERATLQADVESARVVQGLPQPVPVEQAQVRIPDLHAGAVMTVQAEAHGPAQSFLAYVGNTRLADFTGHFLSQTQATGELRVPATVVMPFGHPERTEVAGEVELAGNTVRLHPAAPPLADSRGTVLFTHNSVGVRALQARFLGRPLRAEGVMPLAGGQGIVVRGGVQADAMRRLWGYAWLDRLQGATAFTARIASGPSGPGLVLDSDLSGLGLALPAPLGKPASAAWPTRIELVRGAVPGVRRLNVDLRERASLAAEFGADTGMRPLRAGLGVGTGATLPDTGLRIDAAAKVVDLGAWGGAIASLMAEETAQGGAQAGGEGTGNDLGAWLASAPLQAHLRAQRAEALGLGFDEMDVNAQRLSGERWRARIRARQADGTLDALGPTDALQGRFSRLALQPLASAAQDEQAPVPETLARLPDIALDVEDFSFDRWALGKLHLRATNRPGNTPVWQVQTLRIENPAASLDATGEWRASTGGLQRRRTTLDVSLAVRDAGALADRLGLPGVLAGGAGYAKGSVGWEGHPFSYDLQGTDLHLGIALDHGRFLEAPDSRLLGILSLQTLARTATFQQGGLFQSGFAWDTLRAEVSAARGSATLDSFALRGPTASVVMSGGLDLMQRTQDLRAVIVPHVDASAAALLAGVAINPLVGAGAFLAQLLLREPLAAALTFQYDIRGRWDEPRVERVSSR
ncbi:hypothetical protein FOZ76_06750 [Verticiella sediminum]|uniref:YhdP central domain-containing protein n=1 Tax=Verticiella sediminum TaxID=1247510 RepID=A0A556AX78_9BURK|nr:AsmA-like C-terminal region-containing protein [Verticiella sediminum]TSH97015.1 hypothetical protein FOZ76_06750 [Verticiella sediminum]